MPVFQYQAVSKNKTSRGYITSDTPSQGRQVLRERGLKIIEFKDAGQQSTESWSIPFTGKKRNVQSINEFTRYLAIMLRSGVPLSEALSVIIRQLPKRTEPVLRRLAERVNGGAELAQAMAPESRYFDETYLGIVRVGQASGRLEECLERLAWLRERQNQISRKIHAALAYPAMVMMVGTAVVLFLVTFVVPRITWVLEQSGRQLPAPTKMLMFISNIFVGYWWLILLLLLAGMLIIPMLDRKRRLNSLMKRLILKIPVLGNLIMKADIAQVAVLLDTMLRSGLPLDEAIVITQKSTPNVLLVQELQRMVKALRSGRPLIASAHKTSVFPPVVAHMIAVGEQTGQLEYTLQQLSHSYDNEVEVACRQAVSMIEPILIVTMGCVVGFIVMSTILPILRISGSL